MRIINAGGFNKTERKQWRAIIFNNLVSAFQTIFAAMQEQETDFEDDDNLVRSLGNHSWHETDFASALLNSSLPTQRLASRTACPRIVTPLSAACGPIKECSWPY
jgi:hypothetical protein